jgi:hypothetical protein
MTGSRVTAHVRACGAPPIEGVRAPQAFAHLRAICAGICADTCAEAESQAMGHGSQRSAPAWPSGVGPAPSARAPAPRPQRAHRSNRHATNLHSGVKVRSARTDLISLQRFAYPLALKAPRETLDRRCKARTTNGLVIRDSARLSNADRHLREPSNVFLTAVSSCRLLGEVAP